MTIVYCTEKNITIIIEQGTGIDIYARAYVYTIIWRNIGKEMPYDGR
jgi:hypothetical protein